MARQYSQIPDSHIPTKRAQGCCFFSRNDSLDFWEVLQTTGHAQGCFLKSDTWKFWKPLKTTGRTQVCVSAGQNWFQEFLEAPEHYRACSRLFFFLKNGIWDFGSQFWHSGSHPIESAQAQGCFFSEKLAIWDSGSPPIESGRAQGCFLFQKIAIWNSGRPRRSYCVPTVISYTVIALHTVIIVYPDGD